MATKKTPVFVDLIQPYAQSTRASGTTGEVSYNLVNHGGRTLQVTVEAVESCEHDVMKHNTTIRVTSKHMGETSLFCHVCDEKTILPLSTKKV